MLAELHQGLVLEAAYGLGLHLKLAGHIGNVHVIVEEHAQYLVLPIGEETWGQLEAASEKNVFVRRNGVV
jgi:hypothetical protein